MSMEDLQALVREKVEANVIEDARFPVEEESDVLKRFIIARKGDVDKSVVCMKAAAKWRRECAKEWVERGAEECLGCPVEEISQFYKGSYAGHDKEGRPIWYEIPGQMDVSSLLCLATKEDFLRFHVCQMESMVQDQFKKTSAAFRRTINKSFSIVDLKGLKFADLSSENIDFVKAIAKVDSDNYPETMGKMVIINTPGIFNFAWKVISGFLDPGTVKKVEVLGDENEWVPRLNELVDSSELPAELNGSGPSCISQTKAFIEEEMRSGDVIKDSVLVEEPGTKFMYKFFLRASGDITFSIILEKQDGTTTELLLKKSYSKTECSDGHNVHGTLEVPEKGQVQFVWEHPKWWSRTLLRRIKKLN